MKKALSLLLALILIVSLFPSAYAAEGSGTAVKFDDVWAEDSYHEIFVDSESISNNNIVSGIPVTIYGTMVLATPPEESSENYVDIPGTIKLYEDDTEISPTSNKYENNGFEITFTPSSQDDYPKSHTYKLEFVPSTPDAFSSDPYTKTLNIYKAYATKPDSPAEIVYDGNEHTADIPTGDTVPYTLSGETTKTDAGDYVAVASLKSGYLWDDGTTEGKNITWKILKRSLANCVIEDIPDKTYTGSAITPEVKVKPVAGSTKYLEKNIDYTVSYSNNVKAGTATATIKGVNGSKNYLSDASSTNSTDFNIIRSTSIDSLSLTEKSISKDDGGTTELSGKISPKMSGSLTLTSSPAGLVFPSQPIAVTDGTFDPIEINVPAGLNTGTYKITANFIPEDTYYTGSSKDINLTVFQPNAEITYEYDNSIGTCDKDISKTGTFTGSTGDDGKIAELPTVVYASDGYVGTESNVWIDGSGKIVDSNTVIADNTTLYAVIYTADFEPNGGTPAPKSQFVAYGSRIVKPDDPSKSGYEFEYWEDADNNKFDFSEPITIPLNPRGIGVIDLNAKYAKQYELTVRVNSAGGGTAKAETYMLAEGKTTTITATADDSHVFNTWAKVSGAGSQISGPSNAKTTFTMGNEDAVVEASFNQGYKINLINSPSEGGTLKSDYKIAEPGDIVTITVSPASDYLLNKLTVKTAYNGDKVETDPNYAETDRNSFASTSTYKFTMPAEDVNVTGYFEKGHIVTLKKGNSYGTLYWGYSPNEAMSGDPDHEVTTSKSVKVPVWGDDQVYLYSVPTSGYYTNHSTLTKGYWNSQPTTNLYSISQVSGDMTVTVTYRTTPQTGDSSSPFLFLTLMFVSLAAAGCIVFYCKRRKTS